MNATTTTKVPRPYQQISRGVIPHAWRTGHRGVVLSYPTGGGKTFVASLIARRAIERGGTVLWVAHLDLLLGQAVGDLRAEGLDPRPIAGTDWGERRHPLHVASMQTLAARIASHRLRIEPDVIVIDEAHRAVCATYLRILARWPNAKVLLLTATPWRTDGQPLAAAGATLLVSPVSPDELVAGGVLAPVEAIAPQTAAAGLKGRFSEKAAEKAAQPGLGDVIRGIERACRREPGLTLAVFAASVRHSEAIVEELQRRGLAAEHVDARTDEDTRRAILGPGGRVATGETRVVSNVRLLIEGVDCPALGGVVLAAATSSSGSYLQAVGRGLRAAPGKRRCLLLDYGWNILRHWWPLEDVRALCSLEGGAPRPEQVQEEAAIPIRQCKACFAVLPGRAVRDDSGALQARGWAPGTPCPSCGHLEPPKPVRIVDRDMETAAVTRAQAVPRVTKLAAWREIAEEGRRRGYQRMWALLRFKSRFGHAPEKGWLALYGQPWTTDGAGHGQ